MPNQQTLLSKYFKPVAKTCPQSLAPTASAISETLLRNPDEQHHSPSRKRARVNGGEEFKLKQGVVVLITSSDEEDEDAEEARPSTQPKLGQSGQFVLLNSRKSDRLTEVSVLEQH